MTLTLPEWALPLIGLFALALLVWRFREGLGVALGMALLAAVFAGDQQPAYAVATIISVILIASVALSCWFVWSVFGLWGVFLVAVMLGLYLAYSVGRDHGGRYD